jgi:DNA repair photolyase
MDKLQAIYEPQGRAAEYAKLAVNLYRGCTHGCVYCYAPDVLHMDKAAFHAECAPRPGIIQKLEHDAGVLMREGVTEPVLFCFACDPYSPGADLTHAALATLCGYGVHFTVLTKGIDAWRDFPLYGPGDSFGVTLTCLSNTDAWTWEPRAASTTDRLDLLRTAHAQGIRTWVSLEPVLYPEQTLRLIDATQGYTDHYKVGKLNYHAHASTIDWRTFLSEVRTKLDSYGASYYIKADLAAYGEGA